MSAAPMAAFTAALRVRTISAGVPAGATIPLHDSDTKPGNPLSIMVGTSASSALRAGPVTASGRSLPSLMCPSSTEVGSNAMSIWPVSMSVTALAAPR